MPLSVSASQVAIALVTPVGSIPADQKAAEQPLPGSAYQRGQDSTTLSAAARDRLALSSATPSASADPSSAKGLKTNVQDYFQTITLNKTYQSYADIINSSTSSNQDKLSAYSSYRIGISIQDTTYTKWGATPEQSKQEAKFDFETKDSVLFSADKNLKNFDLQKQRQTIDTFSWNLIFAISSGTNASLLNDPRSVNVNHDPGFIVSGKPTDLKTSIAKAVADTLKQLGGSKTGDDGLGTLNSLVSQAVANFEQRAKTAAPSYTTNA